jgi:hypothetical protein
MSQAVEDYSQTSQTLQVPESIMLTGEEQNLPCMEYIVKKKMLKRQNLALTESHSLPHEVIAVAVPWLNIHFLAFSMEPSPVVGPSPSNLRVTYVSTEPNMMLWPSMCNPQPPSSFCDFIESRKLMGRGMQLGR